MTPINERQHARFYLYKNKNIPKRLYINTKIQTLCKKQDNWRYVFIDKKAYTLCYTIFHEILKLAFIYTQKAQHFALHNVYIYKKPDTSKQNTTICVTFFKYKKPDTLRYAIFHGIFVNGGGGGGGGYTKDNAI